MSDGFSLLDVGLVAEVCQQVNLAKQAERPVGIGSSVVLLSARGGYVKDSSSVGIRTDALDEHSGRRFDGVFIMLGNESDIALTDSSMIGPLRKLLSNANTVEWNDRSSRLVEATGYRRHSSFGISDSGAQYQRHSIGARESTRFARRDASSPLAAALSLIPENLGIEIAQRITRHVTSSNLDFPSVETDASDEIDATHRVQKAGQWLRENCKRSISIAQAAEVAGMSERNFLRRFKVETGVTPSEYLLNARFEITCHLLKKTTLPVDKIARRCGLGSGERLSRVFRRRMSLTPSEYRAAHRGQVDAE
ncbi:helix-turn-helix domain-containing protein [Caballeronia sordidicola]|uniref:helix-turn-helix domain-containing protein n=1 Tax=Caballeronia sordidicola TaxID=196367 RepID=UPI000B796FF6|nr:helix-turn-helix domain-containing protein [Caballeronia sordidicola]